MVKPTRPHPAAETVQEEPTAPRRRDEAGYELDGHGLPLSGPARARRLAELDIADPAVRAAAPDEDEASTAPLPPIDADPSANPQPTE